MLEQTYLNAYIRYYFGPLVSSGVMTIEEVKNKHLKLTRRIRNISHTIPLGTAATVSQREELYESFAALKEAHSLKYPSYDMIMDSRYFELI